MGQCRNCKKEVAKDATICPYCLTSMPTNQFIANVKSVIILIVVLGIFVLSLYFLISDLGGGSFGKGFLTVVGVVLIAGSVVVFGFGRELFKDYKNNLYYISTLISALMIVLGIVAIVKVF